MWRDPPLVVPGAPGGVGGSRRCRPSRAVSAFPALTALSALSGGVGVPGGLRLSLLADKTEALIVKGGIS